MEGGWNSPEPITRRNDEPGNKPTAFSARVTMDMKKMIERVLQQNKLLLVPEEQS